MVGKVLAWKKANPDEAERVWTELGESNGRLRDSFAALGRRAAEDREAYEREVVRLAGLPASEVRPLELFARCTVCSRSEAADSPRPLLLLPQWTDSSMPFPDAVNDILVRPLSPPSLSPHPPSQARTDPLSRPWAPRARPQTIRQHIRHMGTASGVPIEPREQTQLLDACSALPGVVGAGVPGGASRSRSLSAPPKVTPCGFRCATCEVRTLTLSLTLAAGGYDAIWILCLAPPPPPPPSSSSSATSAPAPSTAVEALLRSYTAMSVGPLSRTAWAQGGTVEGEKGLLRERVEEVEGLREAVERGRRQ